MGKKIKLALIERKREDIETTSIEQQKVISHKKQHVSHDRVIIRTGTPIVTTEKRSQRLPKNPTNVSETYKDDSRNVRRGVRSITDRHSSNVDCFVIVYFRSLSACGRERVGYFTRLARNSTVSGKRKQQNAT